jgi:hypothetical protein
MINFVRQPLGAHGPDDDLLVLCGTVVTTILSPNTQIGIGSAAADSSLTIKAFPPLSGAASVRIDLIG